MAQELNTPKNNLPAFMHYQRDIMTKLKDKYAEQLNSSDNSVRTKAILDLQQEVGREWSRIQRAESPADQTLRDYWNRIAAEDLTRYQREMAEYVAAVEAAKNAPQQAPKNPTTVEDLSKTFGIIPEDLMCTICQDFFYEPLVLQCGHKFCASCLSKTRTRSQAYRREKIIRCANCRADQVVDFSRVRPDPIIEALLKKVMGEQYGEGRNMVDKETAIQSLATWYMGGADCSVLIDEITNEVAQQYMDKNIGTIQVNPSRFMAEIFGQEISSIAGFPLGKLAYYHLHRFLRGTDLGSCMRVLIFDDKATIVNSKIVTNDRSFVEMIARQQSWEQKEIIYQLKIYISDIDRGNKVSHEFENMIKAKIPDNFRGEFNITNWLRAKDNPERIVREYFTEMYDTIIARPHEYPTFNEYIKSLRP